MDSSFMKDVEGAKLCKNAIDLMNKGKHIKALEIFEDVLSVHREANDSWLLHVDQGKIFLELAEKAEDPDMEIAYLLGCVSCFSENVRLSELCAQALHMLAKKLGSVLYYKQCLYKAKEGLSETYPDKATSAAPASHRELINQKKKGLERLLKEAEFKIAASKISPLQISEPRVRESKKFPEPSKDKFKGLRSFWVGLDVNIRRDFMKVSISKLISFVEGVNKRKGRVALEEVLASAKEHRKWTIWMCRTKCSEKLSSAEECMNHLEQHHAADCKPYSKKEMMIKRIGKDWTRKISIGSWEPVDAVAAVEMIKNQLEDVKVFASKSKNGWSKEWPLAADEERGKLLKEIKLLLVSLCDHKILSCSIRDWVMLFPVKHLGKLEVSQQSLTDSHLAETPQSICFLECHELNQILDFLKTIKCERNDGTDFVCRAVKSFLSRIQVKEKIDFDPEFSFLLLDRRLLKTNNVSVDDEGTIDVFDPNVHYAKAHAQGDDIISWLTDYDSVDKTFPRPIREYNPDIWVAVLRAVQFTCRTLETKYAKKRQAVHYDAALSTMAYFCLSEDERRKNLQENQWNRYASLLCDRCEERVLGNSLTTKLFLCAVRDILEGASHPSFDLPSSEDCMNLIREHKSLSDDKVLKSIELLQSVLIQKVLRIDSKILLIDNTRTTLLNNLTRLSVFDNRNYILQMLKPFLLNEIMNMETKAKSHAAEAEADLLLEEEKKSHSKKKKNKSKSKKRTSSSKSCTLDKIVEHEPSVDLEREGTSPSLIMVEEDSMEAEDIQNMPGEDPPEEATARYNSALDMTLKALLKIKVLKDDLMVNKEPFQGQLEEQVPSSLQNLFTAYVSEEIKIEGVYSSLLRDFLASIEQVLPMSNDAAEVLVAMLEFWHCWKNPERESLVTRLFTLEESERMICRKCRRITNYPEQSSYGIIMAANSIRELKCAFGNITFVDTLKAIRMEHKMLCGIKTGGCGKTHFVHHNISRCPPIFTIVLEWEKSATEKEISETTKDLDGKIDISRLYKGLEPNTMYRLVSMVGCGEEEEEEDICLAYEKNRWVNLRRESLAGEDVGKWKSVVRFCEERKIRPKVLFYEAA